MEIKYIKYHNYRCFKDVTVKFETTSEKNISLVKGVIGSGKTEMLFSFQWVLYGFDFNSMREKEETPYSLNSTLYHRLEIDRHAPSVDCRAELSFIHKGVEYFMKRTETFMRLGDKVETKTTVELSHTEPNGERTVAEKNKEIVEAQLSRMIPKTILEGITFDGERMKKLNNTAGDQSKKTIKNVISLVTNESLFTLCKEEIKHVKEEVRKEKKRIDKNSGNSSAEALEDEIAELENAIEDNKIKLYGIRKNQDKVQGELDEVSQILSSLEEAKSQEQKRKGLERDLEREKKTHSQNVELFYKRLSDGYALVTDRLMADVKNSLEKVDVPTGLTVEAVKSILKRPKCICGCDMTDDIVKHLTKMLSTLPPDNISSTLLYMANQFGDEKVRAQKLLKETYKAMHESEDRVAEIKSELSGISDSLIMNVSETVRENESKRANLLQKQGRLIQDEERCGYEIERSERRLKEAKKELSDASGNLEQIQILEKQQGLLDMFKIAIEKIEEKNSELSLESINEYLAKAYSLLSEDVGRGLYLCQYDKKEKYRLLTYIKSQYEERAAACKNGGQYLTLTQEGHSDQEIKEMLIFNAKEGKSTGQSKTNSLAFAKAILDFSNEDRSDDTLQTSHDYPFLIDSPFSEISGDNLTNIAKHIHSFASQVILMADDNTYAGVEKYVAPYVGSQTYLAKDKIKGVTYTK